MRLRDLLLLAGLLLSARPGAREDLVVLSSGKELRGRVVYEDERRLVLRQGARDTAIERRDVQRCDSALARLRELLANAARHELDLQRCELLAEQAGDAGLEGEQKNFLWRMLRLDPAHDAAHRALGHRPDLAHPGRWLVPLDTRRVDYEQRFEDAARWDTAWELEGYHYRLRSNLGLEVNLDALLGLERLYLAFYQLFGAELGLYEVCRPMNVALHADAASYPPSGSPYGHYEPLTDTIHMQAAGGLAWPTLAHEAVHQLLYDTAFRERNRSGALPAWLDEGLAEYVAAGVGEPAATLTFEAGRPARRHFETHARARPPMELEELLGLQVEDFDARAERDLKYAQSYTLVHYLLHGDEGRWRAGFLEYLRSVYETKGARPDLLEHYSGQRRKLEKGWTAYAHAQAGE